MKKIILTIAGVLLMLSAGARFHMPDVWGRLLTAEEITFYTRLHDALYTSLPHQYKNWKVVEDGREFDIKRFWCNDENAGCFGYCIKTIGVTDPYALVYNIEFTMPDDEKGKLMAAAYKNIKDFNDAVQIATALKATNKSKLKISIFNNLNSSVELPATYCPQTPSVNIQLPVTATLATKFIRSEKCPMMSSGRVDMTGEYYDNALIFLGKPVVNKQDVSRDDGISQTNYFIGFDDSKIGKVITQNVVVKIKGDAADIDAIVKLIDWQKLYDLIGK